MAQQHFARFVKLVDDVRQEIAECTVADVKQRMDGEESLLLVDVREAAEYEQGHIPGAIHLGKGIIERDIEAVVPNSDTEILLYCGGGYRSALAAFNLQRMGYTHVISVDGGMRGWREAGHPVEFPG